MSKFLLYITLSLALHIFAVFPLLAEQSAGPSVVSTELSEPSALLSEPSALPMPKILMKPAKQVVAVPLESVVQPNLPPAVQKTAMLVAEKPVLKSKPKTETQVNKPAVKTTQQLEKVMQTQTQQVIETPQVAKPLLKKQQVQDAAASVSTQHAAVEKQRPVNSNTSSLATSAVQSLAPAAEVISKEPRFARAPAAPIYPAQAKRRQQQGTVWVNVGLDADGQQVDLQLLRSSGLPSLDQAALTAVRQWQFLPETRNGVGVPSRVHIPIEFAITAQR